MRAPALKLVLDTFIELAGMQPSPLPAAVPSPSQRAVADQARRTVAGRIAEFEAERDPFEEPPRGRL